MVVVDLLIVTAIVGFCNCLMFCCTLLCVPSGFAIVLIARGGRGGAGCFAWFVFLVSRGCCVALPRGAMGLSTVCDCGVTDHTHLLF